MPVWQYPKELWLDKKFHYEKEKHGEMREKITSKIIELMKQAY
ncbi:hypothetical protein QFZ31_000288 [Neobacillus niacini]|nr:hypothetical protein [Neobacillus niacini]MDQ0970410.1 hypothetical protein [Neobacillus niacini]